MAGELALINPLWGYFDAGPIVITAGLGFLIGGALPLVLAVVATAKGLLARRHRISQLLLVLWFFFVMPGLSATTGLLTGLTFGLERQLYPLLDQVKPQVQAVANQVLSEFRAYLSTVGGQVPAVSAGSGSAADALVEGFRQGHPVPGLADGDRTTLWQRGGLILVDQFRRVFLDMVVSDALADQPPGAGLLSKAQLKQAVDAAAARLLNADVLIQMFKGVIKSEARRIYRSTLWAWLLMVAVTVMEITGSRWLGLRGLSPRPATSV